MLRPLLNRPFSLLGAILLKLLTVTYELELEAHPTAVTHLFTPEVRITSKPGAVRRIRVYAHYPLGVPTKSGSIQLASWSSLAAKALLKGAPQVGKGGFGPVYRCDWEGQAVAVKPRAAHGLRSLLKPVFPFHGAI